MKGVLISKSQRHMDIIFSANLSKYSFNSLLTATFVLLATLGTIISLKMDLKYFLFMKEMRPMKV